MRTTLSGMLMTPWGETLDRNAVLQEYPRPQLVRDSYLNLNGPWDYAVVPVTHTSRPSFDATILVPFAPEAPLSGVDHVLQPDEFGWYRRTFRLPEGFVKDRVLLHFGAVDQDCHVWIDGSPAGEHTGGVLPFTLDITEFLHRDEHEIVVRVRDVTDTSYRSRGKQSLHPGGIWYTPSSGIWQTVWIESVACQHIRKVEYVPLLDSNEVEVTVHASQPGQAQVMITATGNQIATERIATETPTRIHIPDAHHWSPEDPFLYDVEVTLDTDRVTSYFGMREVRVHRDPQGHMRVFLNGEPILIKGLLDQGYWPDGLLTAPSDEALSYDVALAKSLGFNTLRKHIKVEPLRWYHHCDRIGMLVWQDMVNGGTHQSRIVREGPNVAAMKRDDHHYTPFGRSDEEGRKEFLDELTGTVELLQAVPSIIVWVPFNEGWGQFDALAATSRIRELDPTRLVDHASGWYDQGGGDFTSQHVYLRSYEPSEEDCTGSRALALTEYGGYSHRVPGHVAAKKEYGYRRFANLGKFELAYQKLHRTEIAAAIERGLSALIYTQLSDVEEETNGLVTYDRRIVKLDEARSLGIMSTLDEAFRRSLGEQPRPPRIAEREITEPVNLTMPNGRLNAAAVGWSRTPLIRTDGIGGLRRFGRNKRWEHWGITTDSHVLGMTISHLDYAGVLGFYMYDRNTGQEWVTDAVVPLGGQVELPGTIGEGRSYAKTKKLFLRFDEVPSGTRLRGTAGEVSFDIVAHLDEQRDLLGVVVPWNDKTFQYTVKDVGRRATGTIWIGEKAHDVSGAEAFATLDHGRGRWPYNIRWNWAVGAGYVDDQLITLQLGGKWTDATGSTENAVVVGPRLHKISEELLWDYDTTDFMRPWRVTGTGIDLLFTPFHVRVAAMNLGVLSSDTHQAFGTWSGTVTVDEQRICVDGLTGWAEDVHNRW